MKQHLNFSLLVAICLYHFLTAASCKPDPIEPPSNNPVTPMDNYFFSQPQYQFELFFTGPRGFRQIGAIKENVLVRSQSGSGYSATAAFVPFEVSKFGVLKLYNFSVTRTSNTTSVPITFCFDINESGNAVYAVIDGVLYKFDLTGSQTNLSGKKITDNFGEAQCIKIISENEIILTTTASNGSLISVKDDGSKRLIASDMGNVGVFDIKGSDIYIVIKNSTGNVIKVTPNGVKSTILSDLNFPSNLCFDEFGNFILQTKWTNDGATYEVYDIYESTGKFISELFDNRNILIVSGPATITPMYVDKFNNLYFSHNNFASNSFGRTNCNPLSTQAGVWKIKLQK